jgi:uncharacterized membrane-anchored protein YitT (DUF2179 family)
MNPFWSNIIIKTTLQQKQKDRETKRIYSNYQLAKGLREFKINLIRHVKDLILITLGIFSASFGFKGFLMANNFIDGGATGISLLISALTGTPLYLLLILVNMPFILLARKVMGKQFAFKTAIAIGGLALCVGLVDFPSVTHDSLLVAVFGGFFLGAGIGMAVRGGAVIDGTEVLAIYLSKKLGTTLGDIIIIINVLVFSAGAYFLSIEIALYSMITYLSASKTLDFLVEGIDEYIGVTIISGYSKQIQEMISNHLGRGVTIYKGKRGNGIEGVCKETEILYTVITRLELNRLKVEIEKIDTTAFVVMNSVKDTKGGMIKKRPLDH